MLSTLLAATLRRALPRDTYSSSSIPVYHHFGIFLHQKGNPHQIQHCTQHTYLCKLPFSACCFSDDMFVFHSNAERLILPAVLLTNLKRLQSSVLRRICTLYKACTNGSLSSGGNACVRVSARVHKLIHAKHARHTGGMKHLKIKLQSTMDQVAEVFFPMILRYTLPPWVVYLKADGWTLG